MVRSRNCCDCCRDHLLRGGKEGASTDIRTAEDTKIDLTEEVNIILEAVNVLGDGGSMSVIAGMARGGER